MTRSRRLGLLSTILPSIHFVADYGNEPVVRIEVGENLGKLYYHCNRQNSLDTMLTPQISLLTLAQLKGFS